MRVNNQVPTVGIVFIGRNEGERLKNCVRSIAADRFPAVYVDSGSSDGSVEFCRSAGITIVALDLTKPFTAARARNEGFLQLIKQHPDIRYVQFIDGDCQLDSGWMARAQHFLDENLRYAAVCGRRRELSPDASIYNKLCDIEWNTPHGTTESCGGDVLMRVDAFKQVGGFNAQLIAGEEPELCYRLRAKGWQIMRLDAEMTLHDAQMHKFASWWRRSKRAGYACANAVFLHGRSEERFFVRPLARILFWGCAFPLAILLASFAHPFALLLVLAYPLQMLRLVFKGPENLRTNIYWAFFLVLGKFSEFTGVLQCIYDQFSKRTAVLIEYK